MQLNANKPFIIISQKKAYTHAIKAAAEEISARVLKPTDLIHDDKKQFPKQKQWLRFVASSPDLYLII